MANPKIIAAIPNYNMSSGLKRLLSQIVTMGYDEVYVLDDASTDNSEEVSSSFKGVRFVSLPTNQGSSAARNQILSVISEPCVIHFLDADVILQSNPVPIIRQQVFTKNTGLIGGAVYTAKNEPDRWNFGPRLTLWSAISTIVYNSCVLLGGESRRNRLLRFFHNRPYAQRKYAHVQPYWVLESNFFIKSETFKKFGGFDSSLREHDIQPLAHRLYTEGYINELNPEVSVIRTKALRVRKYNRIVVLIKAEVYMVRKYISLRKYLGF